MKKNHPNVVLITIDSLRKDFVSIYSNRIFKITPFLDELGNNGIFFSKAFSIGPNTPHSMPGIISGTFPGFYKKEYGIKKAASTISEYFKSLNYITIGFTMGNIYVSRYYSYDRGFDVFSDYHKLRTNTNTSKKGIVKKSIHLLGKKVRDVSPLIYYKYLLKTLYKYRKEEINYNYPYITAKDGNNEIIKVLKNIKNGSFFLWIHYNDVHTPYRYIDGIPKWLQNYLRAIVGAYQWSNISGLKILNDLEIDLIKKMYVQGIKYLDDQISFLFEFIVRNFENTLFVITADHGEEFFENGDFEHKSKLIEELLSVPLILYSKNSIYLDNVMRLYNLEKPFSCITIPKLIIEATNLIKNKIFNKLTYVNSLIKNTVFFQGFHLGNNIPPQLNISNYVEVFEKIGYLSENGIIVEWDENIETIPGDPLLREFYNLEKKSYLQENLANYKLKIQKKLRKS